MKVTFNWSKMYDVTMETYDKETQTKITRDFSINQLFDIKNYVRACEVAEFIMENYNVKDEPTAITLGIEARDLMLEDEISEEEAICEVLDKYGYLEENEDE